MNGNINNQSDNRIYGLDLLRIVCMIMIPILHILNYGGVLRNAGMLSSDYDSIWLLNIICFAAVDAFGLLSGYVGYGKKVRYSNLALLWLRVIFYSVVLTVIYAVIFTGELNAKDIIEAFIPAVLWRYWYFSAYVGLFMFMPFVNKALETFSKKTLYLFCIAFIILFSVLPTFTEHTGAFNFNNGLSFPWLLVLYFFGGVIKKYGLLSKRKWWVWGLMYVNGTMIVWLFKIIVHWKPLTVFGISVSDGALMNYLSPFVLLAALGLVGMFANFRIKSGSPGQKLISFFSPLCFSVYLIHEHPCVRTALFKEKYDFLLAYKPIFLTLWVIGFGLVIFTVCSLADELRELLFKVLKLKKRLQKLEQTLDEKLTKIFASE